MSKSNRYSILTFQHQSLYYLIILYSINHILYIFIFYIENNNNNTENEKIKKHFLKYENKIIFLGERERKYRKEISFLVISTVD